MGEQFSISSIAKKIEADPEYRNKLEKGVPQYVDFKGNNNVNYFNIYIDSKQVVNKNDDLGKIVFISDLPGRYLKPTDLGMFVLNKALQYTDTIYSDNENIKADGRLLLGTIYTPEADFYKENKDAIEAEVKKIQEEKKKIAKAAEKKRKEAEEEQKRQKEEAEKRKKEAEEQELRQFKEEECKRLMDGVRDFLVMLETNIQQKTPIEISTLQKLENDLTKLLEQKGEIDFIKPMELSAEHFVQAYKDCKNNKNLSDSVEDRMLCVWKLFNELLGKSTEDVDAAKKNNQEEKTRPFLKAVDEAVVQLQSKPVNQITVSDLLSVENALSDFASQKFDIDTASFLDKDFERFKDLCEKIIKAKDVGSEVKSKAKDVLGVFGELQEKPQKEIEKVIEQINEDEERERMNGKVASCINLLNETLSSFHSSFVANKALDFERLLVVDGKISELLDLNEWIKDKSSLAEEKDNLKNIFVDCALQGIFSERSSEEKFVNVLGKFITLCDGSTDEMDKIQKEIDERLKEDKKNCLPQKIDDAIARLQSQVSEKQSQITISDLQDLENDLLELKQYSEDLKDFQLFLRWKKYFGELCKDCKRFPGFSKSFAMRVKEIMKLFDFFIKECKKNNK